MKCNKDCLNCQYPDCVNDEFTLAEYDAINSRDVQVKTKGGDLSYYQRHREEILTRQRMHRQENKEKVAARKKRYNETHREAIRAYQREWIRKKRAMQREEVII